MTDYGRAAPPLSIHLAAPYASDHHAAAIAHGTCVAIGHGALAMAVGADIFTGARRARWGDIARMSVLVLRNWWHGNLRWVGVLVGHRRGRKIPHARARRAARTVQLYTNDDFLKPPK